VNLKTGLGSVKATGNITVVLQRWINYLLAHSLTYLLSKCMPLCLTFPNQNNISTTTVCWNLNRFRVWSRWSSQWSRITNTWRH